MQPQDKGLYVCRADNGVAPVAVGKISVKVTGELASGASGTQVFYRQHQTLSRAVYVWEELVSSVTYYYVAECHQQPSSRDWLVDWLLVFLHPCGWPGVQGGGCVDMGSFFFVFVPGAGCWVAGSG